MNEDGCFTVLGLMLAFAIIGAMFGKYIGATNVESKYRNEAVEHGYGEWYAEKPGQPLTKFRWVEPK